VNNADLSKDKKFQRERLQTESRLQISERTLVFAVGMKERRYVWVPTSNDLYYPQRTTNVLFPSNERGTPSNRGSEPAFNHRVLIQMAGVVLELENIAVSDAGEEKVVKPTTKDDFYIFIATLYRLGKRYPHIGFNPDFIHKMFAPLLLNRLSRWDGDIHEAVDLWYTNRAAAEEKYGHISKWDVSQVTNMNELFQDMNSFNEDISAWDTRNVKEMHGMFCHAKAFNMPIGGWDVSNVKSMRWMFRETFSFNQPIGAWNTSKVINMQRMFYRARSFNHPIGSWDVAQVKDIAEMFQSALAFNQNVRDWDVSSAQEIDSTFLYCPILPENRATKGGT